MKINIIYDSLYGNTKKIAEVIADALKSFDIKLINVSEVTQEDVRDVDVLIMGSPTHGGQPKPSTKKFLTQIEQDSLRGIKVATFDTRFLEKDQKFLLRLLIKTIGYASPKMAKILISKGGELIIPAEGFIVIGNGKENSLKEGELERATLWAEKIKNNILK